VHAYGVHDQCEDDPPACGRLWFAHAALIPDSPILAVIMQYGETDLEDCHV